MNSPSFSVPSTPPVNLTSVEVTPRGIKLKWDLPPKEYWNGIIRGFIIMYYRYNFADIIMLFYKGKISLSKSSKCI